MGRRIHTPDREAMRRRIERSRAAAIASRHALDRLDEPATTPGLLRIVHASRAMADIAAWIRLAAGTLRNVLIVGERGTGKSLLAEVIHAEAGGGPFQCFDCREHAAVLPDPHLLRGTLVVDGVDECDQRMQAVLLRTLLNAAHAEHRPRIISLSRRPLEPLVANGWFRGDLHARLQGHQIVIPPLRERPGDIPALASAFAARIAREAGLERAPLRPEDIADLARRPWPGNVAELETVIRQLVIDPATPPAVAFGPVLPSIRTCIDALVDEALRRCGGRQGAAARMIGITPQSLSERLQRRRLREDGSRVAVSGGDG
ncbi:MAG: Transcriptional regulatory protein ZraR [Planctomycetota bacterium]|jgi:DNA-binding NtrC family response regulator